MKTLGQKPKRAAKLTPEQFTEQTDWFNNPEVTVTYFPSNKYGIRAGYYTLSGVIVLLRHYRRYPQAISFIADMLE